MTTVNIDWKHLKYKILSLLNANSLNMTDSNANCLFPQNDLPVGCSLSPE